MNQEAQVREDHDSVRVVIKRKGQTLFVLIPLFLSKKFLFKALKYNSPREIIYLAEGLTRVSWRKYGVVAANNLNAREISFDFDLGEISLNNIDVDPLCECLEKACDKWAITLNYDSIFSPQGPFSRVRTIRNVESVSLKKIESHFIGR